MFFANGVSETLFTVQCLAEGNINGKNSFFRISRIPYTVRTYLVKSS